jgi:hypothetical protein
MSFAEEFDNRLIAANEYLEPNFTVQSTPLITTTPSSRPHNLGDPLQEAWYSLAHSFGDFLSGEEDVNSAIRELSFNLSCLIRNNLTLDGYHLTAEQEQLVELSSFVTLRVARLLLLERQLPTNAEPPIT